MTPGHVDLKIVDERLRIVAVSLDDLRALPQTNLAEFTADRRNPLAADAALRRALEALFDTARHLLAKGFGYGSLEYREVAREVVDRGLITDPQLADRLPRMAGYRNRLTHHYDDITPDELFAIVTTHLGDIERAADALRRAAGRLARH